MTIDIDIKPYYIIGNIERGDCNGIPKQVFQTYKSSIFDSAHGTQLINFRQINADCSYYFYDDISIDDYMAKNWGTHPIFQVYLGVQYGASKADIWRYCVLYDHGGVYLDIDSSILFKVGSIPKDISEAISFEQNKVSDFSGGDWPFVKFFEASNFREDSLAFPGSIVPQWLLIFRKKHWILGRVIELICINSGFYRNRVFDNVLFAVCALAGPILFTQAIWEYSRKGMPLTNFGMEFEGRAIFKSIPNLNESVYLKDSEYYASKRGAEVFTDSSHLVLNNFGPDCAAEWVSNPRVRLLSGYAEFGEHRGIDSIFISNTIEFFSNLEIVRIFDSAAMALRPGGHITVNFLCRDAAEDAYSCGRITYERLQWYGYEAQFQDRSLVAIDGSSQKLRHRKSFVSSLWVNKVLSGIGFKVIVEKDDRGDSVIFSKSGDGILKTIKAKLA